MQLSVRPYVTTGIAIVGASVLVATPVGAPPPEVMHPAQIAVAAQPLASQPLGGILSDLESAVANLLNLLPSSTGGVGTFGSSTGGVGTVGAGSLTPGQALVTVLQREITNITNVVGAAPGELTTLLTDVIQNPGQLPNALSAVAYLLFQLPQVASPAPVPSGATGTAAPIATPGPIAVGGPRSLLGAVLLPFVTTLEEFLPAPLGGGTTFAAGGNPGLIATLYGVVASLVDGALGLLPTPLTSPTPFTSPTIAATAAVTPDPVTAAVTSDPVTAPVTPDPVTSFSVAADTTAVSRVPALNGTRTTPVAKLRVTNANVGGVAANSATPQSLTGQDLTGAPTAKHAAKAAALANDRVAGGGHGGDVKVGRHRAR